MAGDWFVYMVEYQQSRLYTGITTDVERRFAEHCAGGRLAARALRGKGPFSLRYVERVADRSAALQREASIKKMNRQQKLELLERFEAN